MYSNTSGNSNVASGLNALYNNTTGCGNTARKHWLTDEFRAVVEAIIAKNPEQKLYAAYNPG